MFIHWSQFCPLLPCSLILKSLTPGTEPEHAEIHSKIANPSWLTTTFILDSYLVKAGFSPGP